MGKISVSWITVGQLAVNCWFLVNEETGGALVFDPGAEAGRIRAYAEEKGFRIGAILLTHGHMDHMGGAQELKEWCQAKIYAMEQEEELLLDAKKNLSVFIARRASLCVKDCFIQTRTCTFARKAAYMSVYCHKRYRLSEQAADG